MAVLGKVPQQIVRATGTHLSVKADEADKKIANVFRILKAQYEKHLAENPNLEPSGLKAVYSTISTYLLEQKISSGNVFEVWDRIPTPSADVLRSKHVIGWLLAFSNIFELQIGQIVDRLNLAEVFNPWPTIYTRSTSPAASVPEKLTQEDQQKLEELELPEPRAFSDLGSLSGQHFLIIEDSADGGAALCQLLLGAAKHARNSGMDVNGVILDLTGEPYLGLEMDPQTVYLAGELPDIAAKYTLTERQAWFLPQMEAVWRAKEVMESRIHLKQTQARMGQPCEAFSPYWLIIRRWNRVIKEWQKAVKDKEFLPTTMALWREIYGHPESASVNIQDEVDCILDMGDTCGLILALTISRFGKLEVIGMSQNELNAMVIIIVADAAVERGFRAVNAALSDSRLEFCSADEKADLRKQLSRAQGYADRTGHKIALVNRDPAQVMVIETWQFDDTGKRVSIRDYKADVIKGFSRAPSLPGQSP